MKALRVFEFKGNMEPNPNNPIEPHLFTVERPVPKFYVSIPQGFMGASRHMEVGIRVSNQTKDEWDVRLDWGEEIIQSEKPNVLSNIKGWVDGNFEDLMISHSKSTRITESMKFKKQRDPYAALGIGKYVDKFSIGTYIAGAENHDNNKAVKLEKTSAGFELTTDSIGSFHQWEKKEVYDNLKDAYLDFKKFVKDHDLIILNDKIEKT